MTPNLGVAVGLLALAVAVQTIGLSAGDARPSPSGTPANQGTASGGNKDKDDKENAREGPWLATRPFLAPSMAVPIPGKDYDIKPAINALMSPDFSKTSNVQVPVLYGLFGLDAKGNSTACSRSESYSIVATVADPIHTRQALFFDGQVGSIVSAAGGDEWVFARQWLPWFDSFDGSERDINVRREQRRLEREQEALPGILVFRAATLRKLGCLFVLLVPETPTAGIAEDSFIAAMNIADGVNADTVGQGRGSSRKFDHDHPG